MPSSPFTWNSRSPDLDSGDEEFDVVLAACDEALASGDEPVPTDSVGPPPDLHDRLARAVACVRLLREALPGPRRTGGPPPGWRLGDFEVGRELGRGGMGVVYAARQVSLNRPVALKVLGGAMGLTGTAVARFRREAETAARLHHTNIVPIYATGEDGGAHFYAMELIAGPSLDRVLNQLRQSPASNPLTLLTSGAASAAQASTVTFQRNSTDPAVPVGAGSSSLGSDGQYFDTVARLVAEVADALQYAHREGVIHRDIKPSNLLLSPDGRLRLNDFGLARVLEQPGVTATGDFVGTPAYMPPEQITTGQTVDRRTDVYSLGATLYELLTLRPPFAGENRAEILTQVLQKDPTPPRRLNAKVPRDLETICLKAMDKAPSRRYPTAAELASDLRRYLAGEPVVARRVGVLGRAWKLARRRPVVAGLIVALTAVLVGGFAAVTFAWQRTANALSGEKAARAEAEANLAGRTVALARFEWAADRIDEARDLLDQVPPPHRNLEWRLLHRQCNAQVSKFVGHRVGLTAVAYSPDGRFIASGDPTTVKVWEAETETEVLSFGLGANQILDMVLAFSPDGSRLIAAGTGDQAKSPTPRQLRVRVWDVASGEVVGGFTHDDAGYFPCISADGTHVTTSSEKKVIVWGVAAGAPVRTIPVAGHPSSTSFSPDGRLLAIQAGPLGKVHLVSTATCETVTILQAEMKLLPPALSPDGRILAALVRPPKAQTPVTGPFGISFWDVDTSRRLRTAEPLPDRITQLLFSPDGRRLASRGRDGAARLWDVASGELLLTLRGHRDSLMGLAFSPDGRRLATVSQDRTLRVWDITPPED